LIYFIHFFAGALLCNCIPHLVAGLQGEPFPSPFASPPGKGDSAPLVNVLWGSFNLLLGGWLLLGHPVQIGLEPGFLTVLLGAACLGVFLALHFGKVKRDRRAAR
jgi:hypothetical protein